MRKTSLRTVEAGVLKAARRYSPWTLQKFFYYGAAIACSVGVGLGLWLEPPRANIVRAGSMSPDQVQLPEAPQVEPAPFVPRMASYSWYPTSAYPASAYPASAPKLEAPADGAEDAQPQARTEVQTQPQTQPHLIAQFPGPTIQLDDADPAARVHQMPPARYDYRDHRRQEEDLDDGEDVADEEDVPPPPPRWERDSRWPSRDGGEDWRRDDGD
jgi:hypothetical protein